jgi:hypothetical protein
VLKSGLGVSNLQLKEQTPLNHMHALAMASAMSSGPRRLPATLQYPLLFYWDFLLLEEVSPAWFPSCQEHDFRAA